MISKKMATQLNEQINRELYSAYLYQAMSTYFAENGFRGFAAWLGVQAREEAGHAFKFHGYLLDQGAHVQWKEIAAPPATFPSPVAVFEAVVGHEKLITRAVYSLVELAHTENDYATQIFLQWFVTEQVEEESVAEDVLSKVRRLGADERGLYLVDRELGARQAK